MSSTQGQKDGRDKYSLRGRVFQSIREDILSGRYEQNTELKEAAIGAEHRSERPFGSWSWKVW